MKFSGIICLLVSILGEIAVSLSAGEYNLQNIQPNSA